ncbi:MAG: hypothetical protein ACRERV_07220 [Methylococcales bacterium]
MNIPIIVVAVLLFLFLIFFILPSGQKPLVHKEGQNPPPSPDDAPDRVGMEIQTETQGTEHPVLLLTDRHLLYLGKSFPHNPIKEAWLRNKQIALGPVKK